MNTHREGVLLEAMALCTGEREQNYGDPRDSFDALAQMWSAYLGVPVTARDTCNMLALLKVNRLRNGPHRDSSVDGAAYLALGDEVS